MAQSVGSVEAKKLPAAQALARQVSFAASKLAG
jgi:hypothetical protein